MLGHPSFDMWSLRFWTSREVTSGISVDYDPVEDAEIWMAPPTNMPLAYTTEFGAMKTEAYDNSELMDVGFRSIYRFSGDYSNPADVAFTDFEDRVVATLEVEDHTNWLVVGNLQTGSFRTGSDPNSYGRNGTGSDVHRFVNLAEVDPVVFPQGFTPPGTGEAVTMTCSTPFESNEITIQFTLDTSTAEIPNWVNVHILDVGYSEGLMAAGPLQLLMTSGSGDRALLASVRQNGGHWQNMTWLTSDSDVLDITVYLKIDDSAPGEPANGEARLVLGDQETSIKGLANSNYGVDFVTFGGWLLKYNLTAPTSPNMALRYDDVLIAYY